MATLAIPYYGSMVRPHGRSEHIYIKLTADPTSGEFKQTGLCVWDNRKFPDLAAWLSTQEIETLLCNDGHMGSDRAFNAAGVTILHELQGDLQEMINDWMMQTSITGGTIAA